MLIDPFTVFVQVLNFIILVLVLKRFLFRPIIRAMNQREERIAREIEAARKDREEADEELKKMQERKAQLKEEENRLFQDVTNRAANLEKELVAAAKSSAREKEHAFIEAFERTKIRRADELQREMAGHLFAMADTALQDLAGHSLHASMVDRFLNILENDPGSWEKRFHNLLSGHDTLIVSTPFDLEAETSTRLHAVLRKRFGFRGNLDFRRDPELMAGLALSGNGHRLDWTLHRYLEDLKTGLLEKDS
ncbi:F0F1 ATP synthase subunit B family protein [Desulfoplanes sp. PS50]